MEENIHKEYLDANYRLFQALSERIVFYKKFWCYYSSETDVGKALTDPEEIDFESEPESIETLFHKEMARVAKSAKKIEAQLALIAIRAKKQGVALEFENLFREFNLTREERYIVIALFFSFLERQPGMTGDDLLVLFSSTPAEVIAAGVRFLSEDGTLRRRDIISRLHREATLFGDDFILDEWVVDRLIGKRNSFEISQSWKEKLSNRRKGTLLIMREPAISLDKVVLNTEKQEALERALWQVNGSQEIFKDWGFERTIFSGKVVSMLFYGPPGTGKTMTAEAIANKLGKKLGVADYSQIHNMWWGNTEKNITRVFRSAAENDCVLVFDEADSLFGRRLAEQSSNDRSYNTITNLLMQELERFEGVVILTSNREFALDEAFERRISLKLQFDLPTAEERARIWTAFFTDEAPLAPDVDFGELGRRFEISGGNIKNAVLNAVREAGFLSKKITMAMLVRAAEKEKPIINAQSRKIGFQDS
jgi:AAA+ superfamily predicted ATPase